MSTPFQVIETKIALNKKFDEVYSVIPLSSKDNVAHVVSQLMIYIERELPALDKSEKRQFIKDWLSKFPTFSSKINEIDSSFNTLYDLLFLKYSNIHKKTIFQHIKSFLSKKF